MTDCGFPRVVLELQLGLVLINTLQQLCSRLCTNFYMNNYDFPIFTQGIQHFLTIQLFFELVLLNLNKAGKHSRELATTVRLMAAVRDCMEEKNTWPRSTRQLLRRYQIKTRANWRENIVPRKEDNSREIVEERPHFLWLTAQIVTTINNIKSDRWGGTFRSDWP